MARTARSRRRSAAVVVVVLALSLAIAGIGAGAMLRAGARVETVQTVEAQDIAIVLGAGPGPLLRGRMDTACALVAAGKVRRLLLTGLPLEIPYMRERAAGCVGALDDVLVDDRAHRTLASMERARALFHIERAVVVTQPFHLPRALYLARAVGIEATGVAAEGAPSFYTGVVRESVARVRAVVDVWRR